MYIRTKSDINYIRSSANDAYEDGSISQRGYELILNMVIEYVQLLQINKQLEFTNTELTEQVYQLNKQDYENINRPI